MRYLESIEERKRTRALWEEIFPEDSASFLDYYYEEKALENEILVEEAGDEIVSMVQWNPYSLWVNGRLWDSRYLIAVATKPEYRRQKRMAKLLTQGMRDLASKEMPFVWLMPAKAEIYLPFDFRYVYQKWEGDLPAGSGGEGLSVVSLAREDFAAAACFLERELEERFSVFPERSEEYLQRLQKEVASEGGGLAALLQGEELVGIFSYWPGEGNMEIRELIVDGRFLPDFLRLNQPQTAETMRRIDSLAAAIRDYFQKSGFGGAVKGEISVVNTGWLGQEKPAIMARICNFAAFVKEIRSWGPKTVVLQVQDELIPENNGVFRWELTSTDSRLIPSPGETPELALTIGELTEWLLGGDAPEGYSEIIPPKGCFFSEIV
ncbi:GNAT family N-acetyltransferase [Hominifimenecus sp. rT4P-3]|uniref:GNAT family N-acetyltransferase n=1 Tax=Hominifimenecus sp. rT4P-3 TaxID=3242979 RepID=UPI003DA48DBA